ncbi:hypothetical protein YC2023_039334 [Brassica napus]
MWKRKNKYYGTKVTINVWEPKIQQQYEKYLNIIEAGWQPLGDKENPNLLKTNSTASVSRIYMFRLRHIIENTGAASLPVVYKNCDTRHLLYGGQRVTPDASSYNNVTPVSLTLRTTGHQQYPRGAHSLPTNRPKHYRKGARFIHTPKKCSVTHARRRFIDTSSLRLNRSTKVGRDLHTIRHTAIEILSQNAFRTVENGTGQGFRKSQPAGQSQPDGTGMEPALIPNCDTRHLLYGGQRVTPDASSYNNVTPVSLTLRTTGHQQYPRGAHSLPTNRPKHYRKGARFIHTPKKCSVTHARRRFIDTSSLRLNRSTKVGRDLHTIRHTATPYLKSDRNSESERLSNGRKRNWSRFSKKSTRWSKSTR